jgi:hypothetical protein
MIKGVDDDFDQEVNIDEFIKLMSSSVNEHGEDTVKSTIARIRRADMLEVSDLAMLLKRLPKHYEESFTKR